MAHSHIATAPVFAPAAARAAATTPDLLKMLGFTLLAIAALPLLPVLGLAVALTESASKA